MSKPIHGPHAELYPSPMPPPMPASQVIPSTSLLLPSHALVQQQRHSGPQVTTGPVVGGSPLGMPARSVQPAPPPASITASASNNPHLGSSKSFAQGSNRPSPSVPLTSLVSLQRASGGDEVEAGAQPAASQPAAATSSSAGGAQVLGAGVGLQQQQPSMSRPAYAAGLAQQGSLLNRSSTAEGSTVAGTPNRPAVNKPLLDPAAVLKNPPKDKASNSAKSLDGVLLGSPKCMPCKHLCLPPYKAR